MGKSTGNLITSLESHKNADNAHHMAGYMKNQFPLSSGSKHRDVEPLRNNGGNYNLSIQNMTLKQ